MKQEITVKLYLKISSTTLEQAFFLFNLAIFSWAVSEQVTEDVAGVASSCCIKHFLHSVHLKESLSLGFPWPSGE